MSGLLVTLTVRVRPMLPPPVISGLREVGGKGLHVSANDRTSARILLLRPLALIFLVLVCLFVLVNRLFLSSGANEFAVVRTV